MSPTAVRRAFALVGAAVILAVFVVAVSACGRSSGNGEIDVAALQRELARVVRLELTSALFLERDVRVACTPSEEGDLRFSCRVDATNPLKPTQSWTEIVTCREPDGPDTPRCFSESGDALQ